MESKINSVEDAFEYTGRDIKVLELYKQFPEQDRAYEEAGYKQMVIIEALNKEDNGGVKWDPDWEDGTNKYCSYVWLKKNPKGVGFVVDDSYYVGADTYSAVGSRLCLKNPKSVEYLNKKFADIIQIVMAE